MEDQTPYLEEHVNDLPHAEINGITHFTLLSYVLGYI